mmetsp:Transcript_29223/g.26611  ORF Transcript_29223/g.26611 Transcript_29223/m.26611 type:complete len:208 (+) Transcript_29223:3112-3735(+)
MISNTTAQVSTIVVDGTLFINPDATGHVKIYARRIYVRNGVFHFNATSNPNLKVSIHLYSDSENPFTEAQSLNMSTNSDLNKMDKAFIVTGQLQFIGSPKLVWTHLAASASPGDYKITLVDDVSRSWNVGDKIVIAPSGFNTSEFEFFAITEIDGSQIWVDQPIQFFHFGNTSESVNDIGSIDLRTEVASLSSNAVIMGDLSTDDAC